MTEELEQKAEEYAIENLPDGYTTVNYEKKQAYKDGYEQGQKEIEELKWEQKQILEDNENYQKENEELKAKLEHRNCVDCSNHGANIEVIKLKAQIKDLCESLDIMNNRESELLAQIEKMKCCGNCGNERCTSKYRGNSCYHRQEDGYACADNEDWTPRKDK